MRRVHALKASVEATNLPQKMSTVNTVKCSVNGDADGKVVPLHDGTYDRCMSIFTPPSAQKPLPILWWFHGMFADAAHTADGATGRLVSLAKSNGFALVFGEAVQDVFGKGGLWDFVGSPINDTTGTPCGASDSVDVNYMKNAHAYLAQSPDIYDTTRVFTAGCSTGAMYSSYIAQCLKQWEPQHIKAFATVSSGLKSKGDGNLIPRTSMEDKVSWGECDGCMHFPFAPVKYSTPLKACVFDNPNQGSFYRTSRALEQHWQQLGNPVYANYTYGKPTDEHCQNVPFDEIVRCLGVGGTSSLQEVSVDAKGKPRPGQ